MEDRTIFPKIKNIGGIPAEYPLEQVPLAEILRTPEDVTKESEIVQGYTDNRRNFFAGLGN